MGCSWSKENPAAGACAAPTTLESVSVSFTTEAEDSNSSPRTTQLTAHKAKQQASAMMKDQAFIDRPEKEQLALQSEFVNQMEEMRSSDPFSAAIARAMQQQLLGDKLFLALLDLQSPDLKEKVQLAADYCHSTSHVERRARW
jgi:hypothetical protein